MEVQIVAHKFTLDSELLKHIKETLARRKARYASYASVCEVHFSRPNSYYEYLCEVALYSGVHISFVSNVRSDEIFFSFDEAIALLDAKIIRHAAQARAALNSHQSPGTKKAPIYRSLPTF